MSERRFESGFTLVEVLVTVLILGLLAAVVFPVVANRASDADPTVLANDLANIRTGVELFRLDARPALPGDVEDLVHLPSTTSVDSRLDGTDFTNGQVNGWNGPYVDLNVTENSPATSTSIHTSTFDADILNGFVEFDGTNNVATTTANSNNFLAIVIRNLASTDDEFGDLDDLIDKNDEATGISTKRQTGKLRFAGTDAYFLAVPIK